jgi:hypothetical protein
LLILGLVKVVIGIKSLRTRILRAARDPPGWEYGIIVIVALHHLPVILGIAFI